MNGDLRADNILPLVYRTRITVGANGTNVGTLTIDQDGWFRLCYINGVSDQDAATDFQPNNFEVLIKTQSWSMSNLRIAQAVMTPRTTGGYKLPLPIDFAPSTNFQFDVLDISGNASVVDIYFVGYKLLRA